MTIHDLLFGHEGSSPAIGAPGRAWLSYDGLRAQARKVTIQLHEMGIGRGDRVAIVLPNGPEMASAFLCVAQAAVTAPLNPGYREDEFRFYLDDLKARALLVAESYEGPALAVARTRGMQVIRLSVPDGAAAGEFDLACAPSGTADTSAPGAQDEALILHTSGTTSRPRIVPLRHANIAASARNIARTLELAPGDRCINIMPLFHIHGLMAALTASLSAGSATWCAPRFDALRAFDWMSEAAPTWITAVPTMYQAILARAHLHRPVICAAPLRFLRSSSAALPAPVMNDLRRTFGVPVIEAYGMTEAAHQMTSNPLPPGTQVAGAVGFAAGPEVRIAYAQENRFTTATGEVVISGDTVLSRYDADDETNFAAFFEADGRRWFRTGDQGHFDADGYLHLTGRLKEIINRGGEKVSPLEVDAVLLSHPDVAQAVTFALPHGKLGEEVAAAVVLKPGTGASTAQIRQFAATRLAAFKVPRAVVVVQEIPYGATGKLQRLGLADKLGLTRIEAVG